MPYKLKIILTGIALFLTSCSSQEEKIQTALQWSNMNPIPNNATHIQIQEKGSAFTREFIITFQSNKKEITNWLETSAGTKDIKPKKEDNILIYNITETNEAQFAQIKYYSQENKIILRTYWS